ncbi:MAG TPA: DUF58 domain-containing protein [Gemmatimonadaceae bacterium]|nr:DUF58 domain-containing protein [Gemmatimonadaceae bacterium]
MTRLFLRVIPTRRLAMAIAVASVLWLLPARVGIIAGFAGLAVVLALVVVDWVMLPGRRDILVERSVAGSVGIGDDVGGGYTLRSAWPRAVRVRVEDEMPPQVRGGIGTVNVELPARGTASIPFELSGMVRGLATLGRVGTHATSRLALLSARAAFEPADTVLVTPSISNVRRFRLLAVQHRLHTAGVRVLRQRGESRAFAGLREYTVGDDPRHIDWKATARRRKHMLREYTIEQSQTIFTMIESGRAMTQLAGEFSRLEHALSAALVLTDVAATSGDRVGTMVFDQEVRAFVPPNRGDAALRLVRNALIPVAATMTEPDYAGAFRYLATRQRRRALIVFFTDVIDERASRALVAHVTRSATRHLVVVVALRNDDVFQAAVPRGDRDVALYTSAAAEELVAGRQAVLERMRRAGVNVLDVSPQAMTAAVVNKYLEIKGRGAL